eukprot:75835_1
MNGMTSTLTKTNQFNFRTNSSLRWIMIPVSVHHDHAGKATRLLYKAARVLVFTALFYAGAQMVDYVGGAGRALKTWSPGRSLLQYDFDVEAISTDDLSTGELATDDLSTEDLSTEDLSTEDLSTEDLSTEDL